MAQPRYKCTCPVCAEPAVMWADKDVDGGEVYSLQCANADCDLVLRLESEWATVQQNLAAEKQARDATN